jgi:hypothetical protein
MPGVVFLAVFVPSFSHNLSAIASSKMGAEPRVWPFPGPRIFLSSSENLSMLLGISFFGQPVRSK